MNIGAKVETIHRRDEFSAESETEIWIEQEESETFVCHE